MPGPGTGSFPTFFLLDPVFPVLETKEAEAFLVFVALVAVANMWSVEYTPGPTVLLFSEGWVLHRKQQPAHNKQLTVKHTAKVYHDSHGHTKKQIGGEASCVTARDRIDKPVHFRSREICPY